MSDRVDSGVSANTVRVRLTDTGRWLFGDRQGLVLWLGLLVWFGLTWRVGFFIQDTYATANTLVALANGQLHVTELRYSLTFGSQPGLHLIDGRLYGRNYGQLALAVPLVWGLEGLSTIAAPRLLLAGLWAGLGLALVSQLSEFERADRRQTRTVGSAVVAVVFLASVATATELPRDRLALVAYQLSTLLAAATACLVCYRLVGRLHDRRLGLVAGAGLGVATPAGFWATIPKRHTLVALLVLAAVYAFAVSRQRTGRAALRARAGAYVLAGSITWVHAFEALFAVAVLGVVDLLTARSNGVKQLVVIGLALSVAITPMAVTNHAISGNPAQPPRVFSSVDIDTEFSPVLDSPDPGEATGETTGSAGSDSNGAASGGGSSGVSLPIDALRDAAQTAVGTILSFGGEAAIRGVEALDDGSRLWHTFVRSGTIPSVEYETNGYETIELALLEAMPILGAVVALPVLLGRRLRRLATASPGTLDPRTASPVRQTDLLVVALAVVLTVVYLPRVPLKSLLTVRYLHPVVPLALYGVCRIPAVRAGAAETALLGRAYLAALGFALAVLLGGITGLGLALGEAIQYNALWNLTAATVCAAVVAGRTLRPGRVSARVVAVGLALPAAFTTAYLLLSGLVYFRYGRYAFDVVRVVAGALPGL